jgi:hypothetical protein
MSEAPGITEADWHGQSGRNRRHERKIVRQFEQICNRQGESNIAVKRDVLLLAAAHLCTPLACQRVLIENHAILRNLRFVPVTVRYS